MSMVWTATHRHTSNRTIVLTIVTVNIYLKLHTL